MEPKNPLLVSTGVGLDQSAAGGSRRGTEGIFDAGRLNGCPEVTPFLKVTGKVHQELRAGSTEGRTRLW